MFSENKSSDYIKNCLFYFLAIKKFTAFPAEFDFKASKYKKVYVRHFL